jgi:hypothetical protein
MAAYPIVTFKPKNDKVKIDGEWKTKPNVYRGVRLVEA